ncbi:hypothetical protein J3R30DRAFT_3712029 [Lentinula aciculospora]|uniref:GATA-type domain-containing protein n=1 Tax=Lentinula aciculospora TaxID=153920 RepID=A0A9W9DH05_9AGAR|nr:hypothetical protein J3R30DRAFT_3712029 [Lentinula aciculospora]
MAADSRYLYHPPHQGLAVPQYSYQYQNPPLQTSYEQSPTQHVPPLPPPPLRNMRTSQPSPHSPQAQYHPPPASQSAAYAPAHSPYSPQGHYMTHAQPAPPQSAQPQHTPPPPPQPQQQWSNESWSPQYSHYPSHAPQHHHQQQQQQLSPPLQSTVAPENTYNSPPGRPETSPALSSSSLRGYDDRSATMHSHQQPPLQTSINGGPTTKYRQREDESISPYTSSQPASPNLFTGLDYNQLMKQIKFVESPLRETLSTFRSPHPETLEQMMQAATYAAQVLNSAAGITTTMTTSPAPSVVYHQINVIPTSQGYNNNRLSPPTSRDCMENNIQSPHTHTDNSPPPLSASTTGSLKRRHTNEYPENSQQSPPFGGSGTPSGSVSQASNQQPPPPSSLLVQQPSGQQQQSFSHLQPPAQSQPGGGSGIPGTSNLPPSGQPEGQTCLGCNATSTPEWRRGPMGKCSVFSLASHFAFVGVIGNLANIPNYASCLLLAVRSQRKRRIPYSSLFCLSIGPRTLCNACGLVYAKLVKKRDRERTRANGNGRSSGNSRPASGEGHRSGSGGGDSGSGESDEDEPEDDYGSGTSGRRSEFG